MSKAAWAYIWLVLGGGAIFAVLSVAMSDVTRMQLGLGLLMALLATLAHLYKAEGRNHQALYTTGVVWFSGLLLLEPVLFVMLILVPHVVQWLKERSKRTMLVRLWYLQPFNVAMYLIAGHSARLVYLQLAPTTNVVGSAGNIAAITVAAAVYLVVNQLILGVALVLARGLRWRETGVLELSSLLPEFVMLMLGASVVILWQLAPWLIPLVLSPVALIYQALHIPKLKQDAQTDSKTGLLNSRYFNEKYAEELERAKRLGRPLVVIMADLDYLRTINNSYGHLAGDAVLIGVAGIIRASVRQYDYVGRFGGEEFVMILPETELRDACALAERIRQSIETANFEVASHPAPITATMSFGVACFPRDGATATELSHAADVAVYHAKATGRNRVVCAADLPAELLDQGSPDRVTPEPVVSA